jgi:hypothetical protein
MEQMNEILFPILLRFQDEKRHADSTIANGLKVGI